MTLGKDLSRKMIHSTRMELSKTIWMSDATLSKSRVAPLSIFTTVNAIRVESSTILQTTIRRTIAKDKVGIFQKKNIKAIVGIQKFTSTKITM